MDGKARAQRIAESAGAPGRALRHFDICNTSRKFWTHQSTEDLEECPVRQLVEKNERKAN